MCVNLTGEDIATSAFANSVAFEDIYLVGGPLKLGTNDQLALLFET